MSLSGVRLTLTRPEDEKKQKQAIPVGEGSYASVYQAFFRPSTEKPGGKETALEPFALKCMRFLSGYNAEDLRDQRQV